MAAAAVTPPLAVVAVGTVDGAASSNLQMNGTVYQDHDIMLNQTNLSANNNKFYKLQLIETRRPPGGNRFYTLFTKWGRVGEAGKTQEQGPFLGVETGRSK